MNKQNKSKIPLIKKQVVIEDQTKLPKFIPERPYDKLADENDAYSIYDMKGKSLTVNTIFGEVTFKPFYNSRISNFIDEEGDSINSAPNLAVPVAGKTKDGKYILVYWEDFAVGNALIITPTADFNKSQVCSEMVEMMNLDSMGDDWD